MATRSVSRKQIIAISITGAVVFVAVVTWVFSLIVGGGSGVNPFAGQKLYVYPDSSAAQAAASASGEDAAAFGRIASTPTAIWLTPEQHPTSRVGSFVSTIVGQAASDGSLPVFVVYGIPNRDCTSSADGGQSSGGATVDDYPKWIAAIAGGLAGHRSVVILEPDSLALSQQCGNVDERVSELGSAIGILAGDDTSIYLDGGHSTFLSAEDQAALLNRAGVDRVRGFASNVANYNATADEVTYDTRISQLTNGAHFVIDVGRNGNGTNNDWCNPTGRALGAAPTAIEDGTAHDANLWIKNPGESDGQCNGGPVAGQWWPEGALALASN